MHEGMDQWVGQPHLEAAVLRPFGQLLGEAQAQLPVAQRRQTLISVTSSGCSNSATLAAGVR
jgi:hypothetical protein